MEFFFIINSNLSSSGRRKGKKEKKKKLAYQSAREDGCLFLSTTIFFSHSSSLSVKIQVLLTVQGLTWSWWATCPCCSSQPHPASSRTFSQQMLLSPPPVLPLHPSEGAAPHNSVHRSAEPPSPRCPLSSLTGTAGLAPVHFQRAPNCTGVSRCQVSSAANNN